MTSDQLTSESTSKETRRDALVDAAAAEIHREGYRAASTNRVIEQVGVTKGTLYHYFPDRLPLALRAP